MCHVSCVMSCYIYYCVVCLSWLTVITITFLNFSFSRLTVHNIYIICEMCQKGDVGCVLHKTNIDFLTHFTSSHLSHFRNSWDETRSNHVLPFVRKKTNKKPLYLLIEQQPLTFQYLAQATSSPIPFHSTGYTQWHHQSSTASHPPLETTSPAKWCWSLQRLLCVFGKNWRHNLLEHDGLLLPSNWFLFAVLENINWPLSRFDIRHGQLNSV